MRIVPVALSLCLASIANAAVAQWGQCGGRSYTGDTVCAAGLSCVVLNDCTHIILIFFAKSHSHDGYVGS
ncbi:hypothetical protein BOTBODRAFT_105752 [Botryobasidium botryosum FD-172 SS1]|uniref:CBM1 domain-containing protein n=1 Tax=Botryobasidium botryosum (strain FD-172 SS1) TaxID=930990 RepID=A0A067MRB4_BOTB1|nr:hypothetical protein BOTBODRAFT_105752 [Botryobasidium botryosum FD-172 SS1]